MAKRILVLLLVALPLTAACSENGTAGAAPGGEPDAASTDTDQRPGDADRPDTATVSDSGGVDAPADTGRDTGAGPTAPEYPLSPQPYTTLQRLWAPTVPSAETRARMAAGELRVFDITEFEANGLWVEPVDGFGWVEHNELAPGFSAGDAAARRSLLYFWESADPQMVDEESPIRFEGTTLAPMGSTYRPHSHLVAQIWEASVRTARRISEASGRPFDFMFIAGDLTDGGQENELGWTMQIIEGGEIDPDSGVDDDPVAGPGNDFGDPFWSVGIGEVPWYPAIGNHETNYMGLFPATESVQAAAVGDEVIDFTSEIPLLRDVDGAQNGFRDGSTPNADIVTEGKTPPDPRRRILDLGQVLQAIFEAGDQPDNHGLTSDDVMSERGYYSFRPVAGKPIRFIVLNTLMRDIANASGGIERDQMDWLEGELALAEANDELVIVGSHHRSDSLSPLSVVGKRELRRTLAAHDNVILHVAGHGHHNAKDLIQPDGTRGYWEIMCASTVQFPLQTRIIELVYEGDGYLSTYVTNVGHNSTTDTLAHQARGLSAGQKWFTGVDPRGSWEDSRQTMNLVLRFKLPASIAAKIESQQWPTRVESEETLAAFPVPQ